ncbi:MAG: PKD domain-containing protein [Phycisphaerae bacterium]|nr:PKD domain-containing protein [Saprospiraceae bacterium]
MKSRFTNFIFVMLAFLPGISMAQIANPPIIAVDDSLTVILGQAITYNVKDNDSINFPLPVQLDVEWVDIYPCIGLSADGTLKILPDANSCVGDTLEYTYRYTVCDDSISKCSARVKMLVQRIDDCFFVRMEDFIKQGQVDSPQCAFVCENSASTFVATYNPSSTYTWSVVGGIITPGVNAATVNIAWGPKGAGTVSLTITNGDVSTTINVCVVIMEGPTASFTTSSTNICKNGTVTFNNTSTDGSSFFWDFGDGGISAATSVTHPYTTPGIHTACLIVTRKNPNANGPSCSCNDTMCVEIVVDSLEGPNIFCVSTLCAHDSTKYWTDATCDSLKWTVMEDGLPVTFSGQGNDTICVQWGPGPLGTVTLEVKDCTIAYCAAPVTVTIPIIPSTVVITGEIEVCAGSSETYTVPKWMGVYYDWTVMGAISTTQDGPNTITVQWGAVGTGTITLHYYSDFLSGLPGQDPADCMGTATLNVLIKRTFQINTQPKTAVCANEVSTYTAFPPNAYTWTVSGSSQPLIMGNGTSSITVTWNSGPGNYTITAMPVNPNPFCNDVATKFMQVLDTLPLPWIDGPDTICPGQTYTYFAQTNQIGVGFNWSISNGGVLSTATVNPLIVTWGATGPYVLYLQQFMLADPMCSSDTVALQVNPKKIDSFAIDGPRLVCINSLLDYSATPDQQDPDAIYTWTIEDPLLGSVVLGQGTPDIKVQWNNVADTATLTLTVELCDSTLSVSFPVIIKSPRPLNIMQKDISCPGQDITLEASGGFLKYLWSNLEITQTITNALANTVYTVSTCDSAGCIVIARYDTDTAVVLPAPPSHLPVLISICVLPCDPSTVNINAPSNSSQYSYSWTCDSLPVQNTSSTLTHTNTCEKDTFVYEVKLTDVNTGCMATSETTVIQTDICPGGCDPDTTASIDFMATNQKPDCDSVDFKAMPVNATIIGWDFGDLSSAGPDPNPTHYYDHVGDYTVTLSAQVANMSPPPAFCLISVSHNVHIPLKAKFSCTSNCSKVTFANLTTYNSLPGDVPINWLWEFGDPLNSTSTLEHPPMFIYPGPGNYTVTLTVMNVDSCVSVFTKEITVGGVSLDTILIAPDTACVGTPLSFCGIPPDTNIVQWDWDFGDGSTNGAPKPFHSYLSPDTYTVALTVTDAEGCTDMATISLDVHPSPVYQDITVSPGLIVCDSTEVTLTAPMGDYTYLWSNSSTAQYIKTDSAGTYSVTVTNIYGCTMVPDPVTIVVFSTPQATISGNHYKCNNNPCVTLSAPLGQHYAYLWSNGATSATILVCSAGVYTVMVTDTSTHLRCSAVSDSFSVFVVPAPVPQINISPNECEGVPVMLSVNNIQSDVTYNWNNGAIGTSITVIQAGTYFVIGVDTITGCVGSSFVVIHPLPDLCLVPAGCYEVCNPYTICGPGGLKDYQWTKDGVDSGTDSCLVVTQSGTYSLTGTNSFGCVRTSESLMLTVTDCTCFGLSASASPVGAGSCCWKLSYDNPLNTLYSLTIHSNDANLSFNGLSGPFSTAPGINSITLSNVVPGMPLASGVLSNFLNVCLSNVLNMPQLILFDWYDANHNLLCSDTVKLFSQQILVDTIFLCPGKTVTLGGAPYAAPNIVTVNLHGAGGACDTLATYHLILSPAHVVTLNCPSNITVNAALGETTAVVHYATPTATSTCPGSIPTVVLSSVLPNGNMFPLGQTTVCYLAKDEDDCCSNIDSCCFIITVLPAEEDPCDEQMTACIKFELLDITKDLAGNQTYRMRVTNNCNNDLTYAAFQVPDGITAISPANNAIYTAPSSRTYIVRNPNFSPFYSIRFKSIATGISNGQSDIFEYKLPPQVCQGCILATVRLSPQIFYQAHLCCMMPSSLVVSPTVLDLVESQESPAARADEFEPLDDVLPSQFAIFPNPTDGTLFADLSDWEGEQLQVQIYNSQGQQLQSLSVNAAGVPQIIEMPKDLTDGLYFLEILTGKDERQMARFVLLRN